MVTYQYLSSAQKEVSQVEWTLKRVSGPCSSVVSALSFDASNMYGYTSDTSAAERTVYVINT